MHRARGLESPVTKCIDHSAIFVGTRLAVTVMTPFRQLPSSAGSTHRPRQDGQPLPAELNDF